MQGGARAACARNIRSTTPFLREVGKSTPPRREFGCEVGASRYDDVGTQYTTVVKAVAMYSQVLFGVLPDLLQKRFGYL